MSDPLEGMARAICAAPHDPDDVGTSAQEAMTEHGHQARAAWAYALAALREPSEAVLAIIPYHTFTWMALQVALDVLARDLGLDEPPPAAAPAPPSA